MNRAVPFVAAILGAAALSLQGNPRDVDTAAATGSEADQPCKAAWARQIGPGWPGTSIFTVVAVAVDSAGNAYLTSSTGDRFGDRRFGKYDAFVVKYDPSGKRLWTQQFGTPADDESHGIAVDASGNIHVCGVTKGNLGGRSAGDWDGFLVKYDASGKLLWKQQLGTPAEDWFNAVAVDSSGNVYVGGETEGSLAGTKDKPWGCDVILVKYDASGKLFWSRQIVTPGEISFCLSVAADSSGNVYITGETCGSIGGPNAGWYDAYLIKYDSSGTVLWKRQFGSDLDDCGCSVAVDDAGDPYVGGYTHAIHNGSHPEKKDAFLVKYDASGSQQWYREIGTEKEEEGCCVAVDHSGNAYLGGWTYGSLGGTNAGDCDAFLVKYDDSGKVLWKRQFGTTSYDKAFSVAIGPACSVYVAGETHGGLLGEPRSQGVGPDDFVVKFEDPEKAPPERLPSTGQKTAPGPKKH